MASGDLIQEDGKRGVLGLDWWPQVLTPNGPFVSAMAGVAFGVDTFTGQKIEKPTDDNWDAFKARLIWMGKQFAPPTASDIPKTIDTVYNEKMNLAGAKNQDDDIALMRAVGLRFVQVDLQDRAIMQRKIEKAITNEYKQAASKLKKEAGLYPNYDPEELEEKLNDLKSGLAKKLARELNREMPEEAPE